MQELDNHQDHAQDRVHLGDLGLPEGEVEGEVLGGDCEHQDPEHHGDLLVEIIFLAQEQPGRLEPAQSQHQKYLIEQRQSICNREKSRICSWFNNMTKYCLFLLCDELGFEMRMLLLCSKLVLARIRAHHAQDRAEKCHYLTKVWDVEVFHEEEDRLYSRIKHCVEHVEI